MMSILTSVAMILAVVWLAERFFSNPDAKRIEIPVKVRTKDRPRRIQ
jgi:hypothetical protein